MKRLEFLLIIGILACVTGCQKQSSPEQPVGQEMNESVEAKLVKPHRNPVNSMFSEKRSKIYNYFTTFESHDMILAGVAFTPVFFVVTFLQN